MSVAVSHNPLIVNGASHDDFSAMFQMERSDVRERLNDVPSHGANRLGHALYPIRIAAKRLVKLDPKDSDLVSSILKMHHNDLPKMLAKEYWYAQNQRLNFMERQADLWDTRAVVELASETFKTLRLSLMLLSDSVERETGLNVAQRDIITRLVHVALEEVREKLVNVYERNRGASRGKAFLPEGSDADTEL